MELDYTMFMYATQLRNIDNMIPDHDSRIRSIIQHLSKTAGKPTMETEGKKKVQGHEDEMTEVAKGFREPPTPNLPGLIGHDGRQLFSESMKGKSIDDALAIRKTIEDQFNIPLFSPHLLKPNEKLGLQSVLLFGPPGTGKTLFAQSLATQKGMTL